MLLLPCYLERVMSRKFRVSFDEVGARAELARLIARRETLDIAEAKRRDEFEKRHAELDENIAKLAALIESFSALSEKQDRPDEVLPPNDITPEEGLTHAIAKVLKAAKGRPLTVPEIRDALVAAGFSAKRYANFLGTIGTTLRRMRAQGSVRQSTAMDGKSLGWYPASFLPLRPITSRKK